MGDLADLLAIYKIEKGISTDEALANCLHVSKTAMSNYKAGRRRLPDLAIVELARVTSQPAENVLAIANANFEGTPPDERSVWMSMIEPVADAWRKR